ncbi:MAG: VOC family protein, partial [Nitrospirales bacterium]
MNEVLFHLAFPVTDLAAAKRFYVDGLGCTLGRESATALTLGLAGHQLVAHLAKEAPPSQKGIYPRHFG